jgi:putative Mg2+ transporter-C (MgtC) family protein
MRIFFEHLTVAQNIEMCLRLVLAFMIGGIIGLERSNRFKEAGVRTHIIVCCTTALIMLISKYGFADMGSAEIMEFYGSKGADSARIAAQAVSGISFLCAGVIIKVGGNIRGLTTAAGIWMTAGLGLAIGAGMYVVTGFTVLLILVLQYVLYRFLLQCVLLF